MLLNLVQFDSFHWVGLQHSSDQIFAVRRDLDWHAVVALLDLVKEQGQLLIIKWQASTDHGIKYDATRPYVDFLATVGLTGNNFGCRIIRGAARCAESHAIFCRICKAKVNELDVVILVQQQILRLQVAVYHLVKVRIFDGRNDLLEDAASFIFGEL